MSAADDIARNLEAARETLQAMINFRGPGDSTIKPEFMALQEAKVAALEEAHNMALAGVVPAAPAASQSREPRESREDRVERITASRERRLEAVRARIARDAPLFETPDKPLDHGELSIPGRAGRGMDRMLDRWSAHQKDLRTERHLTALLRREVPGVEPESGPRVWERYADVPVGTEVRNERTYLGVKPEREVTDDEFSPLDYDGPFTEVLDVPDATN